MILNCKRHNVKRRVINPNVEFLNMILLNYIATNLYNNHAASLYK